MDRRAGTPQETSDPCKKMMESFESEKPDFLATVKSDLQGIWSRSVPIALKQPTVDILLNLATRRFGRAGVYAPLPFGHLEFGRQEFSRATRARHSGEQLARGEMREPGVCGALLLYQAQLTEVLRTRRVHTLCGAEKSAEMVDEKSG